MAKAVEALEDAIEILVNIDKFSKSVILKYNIEKKYDRRKEQSDYHL